MLGNDRTKQKWSYVWKSASLICLCFLSGLIGSTFSRHMGSSSYTLSYADFVSIMLTAISLLMTVLAIFLAVAGFVGWTTIEQKVHFKTEEYLSDGFEEKGRLLEMLNSRLGQAANEKTEEIMTIIRANIIEETQKLMFEGVETVQDSGTDGIEKGGGEG